MDDLIRLLQDLRTADERSRTLSRDAREAAEAQRELERLRDQVWSQGRDERASGAGGDRLSGA